MKACVYAARLNLQVGLRRMKKVIKLMDKYPPTELRPEFSHMQQEYSESTILRAKQKYEQGRKYIEQASWLQVPTQQVTETDMD